MIVTGAPVEMMDFEEVDYWDELCKIFDWAKQMCIPHLIYAGERRLRFTIITVFRSICFPRRFSAYFATNRLICIIRFCADFLMFLCSAFTSHGKPKEDIIRVKDLQILSYSEEAGVHLVSDMACRNFYCSGHCEYDSDTLAREYFRDLKRVLT